MREKIKVFEDVRQRGMPLKELSRVKLRRLTREHISKNIPKSSKIHYYCYGADFGIALLHGDSEVLLDTGS